MRRLFLLSVFMVLVLVGGIAIFFRPILWSMVFLGPLIMIGFYDYCQKQHAVLRNFPIIGHIRYLLEAIRPEIAQYFIETETSGVPFSREQRSVVYQRSKRVLDTVPFGTIRDVYEVGYEWVNHSLSPLHLEPKDLRVMVGGPECKQPYSASLLNISAMSFGSLSKNAVLALNQGAKMGNFAHNTGEGGISPYHLEGGGDLIWQIGTGYFGCRNHDGTFNEETFTKRATLPNVKMIEIKLSQGAKPGHGGILPAVKLTKEIAEIRDVPMGQDVLSPPAHSAFSTPVGLLEFVAKLRGLCGGKPVGFKLCLGKRREFLAICKAMMKTGITPDFIAVDGGEGGTGAAPLEFTNSIGAPLIESLIFVHNALLGFSLRDKVRVISSGKISSGFGMVKHLALGADMCNSARAMMLALGCIQARRCNSNECPVGVTTQNPQLVAGLVVREKDKRVANYQDETITSVSEIIGAMGIESPEDLHPWHIMRRTSPTEIKHYGEIYEFLNAGDLLKDPLPISYKRACQSASAETFQHVNV
ncbi:FMN-binding glutamate synthase family protein [candidate division KSB1 bacterium]|nr:FMN-binding glutamate synthase family protein [candidate division KSB1 bacterium]